MTVRMTISLPDGLTEMVERLVAEGRHASHSDVIGDGPRRSDWTLKRGWRKPPSRWRRATGCSLSGALNAASRRRPDELA